MNVVAFDTETKGLRWWDPNEQAFLLTWADERGEYHADLSDPAQVRMALDAMAAADVIVAHNLSFDIHQVRETLGVDLLEGKVAHDTDLMSRVLHPEGQRKGERGGHGLKNLAKVFLSEDAGDPEEAIKEMAKAIGLRTIKQTGAYFEVWRAYPEVMEKYARMDARYTFDLYQKFASSMSDLAKVYELERQVAPIIINAERVGIKTDQAKVQEFKQRFTAEQHALQGRLTTALGNVRGLDHENEYINDDEILSEALLKAGVPLHETTPTGLLCTNKFALQEFERDFPVIADLFEYRRVTRFLNTYIGPTDGQEVLHPSFMQCGAWTGRLSCRSPNMQNWPKRAGKEVRSVLVPRDGCAFVVCDYEGIEERLLAYYLNDPGYRELSATRDPHAWMAAQIWGGAVEDYVKGSDKELTHRGPAKNIKFAITYGAGKRRVRAMLRDAGMPASEEDAAAIISKIKASLPNWWSLNKRVKRKVETHGYVNTIYGRKNPVNKEKAYVGINALIQGSAADIMKLGLVATDAAVRPLGGVILLTVHDEVVVEVPIAHAAKALAVTTAALEGAYQLDPPLSVEGSITTTSYADA